MALVVTLILLSVTLVMAVAFLAISRRERNAVSTTTDTTTAQLATDEALAQAENRIAATIQMTTNSFVSPLIVSTNYINNLGFTPGSANPTNVNYNYLINNGGPLANVTEFDQNIANLFYSPRPPVYSSNLLYNTYDLQFYLDLNRNGRYDTNGWVTNVDNNLNGLGTVSLQVGDPEWIGVLEHPDAPHGPNNPFVARYCFIAVPANSLDLNHIDNQVLNTSLSLNDGYFRDQGVGPWEMNLAAFLADLNSDIWDPPISTGNEYQFLEPSFANRGVAFQDALALTDWRYAYNYGLLGNPNSLFGPSGASAFLNDGIDWYGNSGEQTTFDTNYLGINPNTPWPGADNTNNFFYSPSELFNPARSSSTFVNNL